METPEGDRKELSSVGESKLVEDGGGIYKILVDNGDESLMIETVEIEGGTSNNPVTVLSAESNEESSISATVEFDGDATFDTFRFEDTRSGDNIEYVNVEPDGAPGQDENREVDVTVDNSEDGYIATNNGNGKVDTGKDINFDDYQAGSNAPTAYEGTSEFDIEIKGTEDEIDTAEIADSNPDAELIFEDSSTGEQMTVPIDIGTEEEEEEEEEDGDGDD